MALSSSQRRSSRKLRPGKYALEPGPAPPYRPSRSNLALPVNQLYRGLSAVVEACLIPLDLQSSPTPPPGTRHFHQIAKRYHFRSDTVFNSIGDKQLESFCGVRLMAYSIQPRIPVNIVVPSEIAPFLLEPLPPQVQSLCNSANFK